MADASDSVGEAVTLPMSSVRESEISPVTESAEVTDATPDVAELRSGEDREGVVSVPEARDNAEDVTSVRLARGNVAVVGISADSDD